MLLLKLNLSIGSPFRALHLSEGIKIISKVFQALRSRLKRRRSIAWNSRAYLIKIFVPRKLSLLPGLALLLLCVHAHTLSAQDYEQSKIKAHHMQPLSSPDKLIKNGLEGVETTPEIETGTSEEEPFLHHTLDAQSNEIEESPALILNLQSIQEVWEKTHDLEEALRPYQGRRVQVRGFLHLVEGTRNAPEEESRYLLTQQPQIATCCKHSPRKIEVITVFFNNQDRLGMEGGTDPQEIVVLEGKIELCAGRIHLVESRCLNLRSPVEALWKMLHHWVSAW